MEDFLIKGETLTKIADKFRYYLYPIGDNTHIIDPSLIYGQFGENFFSLEQGAVNFTFYEEFDAAGYPRDQGTYPDGTKDGGFSLCTTRVNDQGYLVPVLVSGGMFDNGEELVSGYYYVGTDTVEGETYDKWRRIEGMNLNDYGEPDSDNYTWDAPFRQYVYTNRIVIPNSENTTQYNPAEYDLAVDDVYAAGKSSSGGQFGSVEYDESTQTLIISD